MGKIKFFANATKVGMPFIRIEEGMFEGLVMMVDTGSNDNLLFCHTYDLLKEQMEPVKGVTSNLSGIGGTNTDLSMMCGPISICGKEYGMQFLVVLNDVGTRLAENVGFPVAGIIGTFFMAEHNWVIDFGKQEILIPDTDFSMEDLRLLRK